MDFLRKVHNVQAMLAALGTISKNPELVGKLLDSYPGFEKTLSTIDVKSIQESTQTQDKRRLPMKRAKKRSIGDIDPYMNFDVFLRHLTSAYVLQQLGIVLT